MDDEVPLLAFWREDQWRSPGRSLRRRRLRGSEEGSKRHWDLATAKRVSGDCDSQAVNTSAKSLYVCSPCLLFASPSNPYTLFMSVVSHDVSKVCSASILPFVSWLPLLRNTLFGYSHLYANTVNATSIDQLPLPGQ